MTLASDFERHGLAGEQLAVVGGKPWLLTIDFEAFRPETITWWVPAMQYWAERATRAGLRFSFFVSIEDVARLRVDADPGPFAAFAAACRALQVSGSDFHPHNHCLFEPETGFRPGEASGFPPRVEGYPRFPSMVYDVVHRNGKTIAAWLPTVVHEYDGFLAAAGLRRPDEIAFRAGGWDYGVSTEDMSDYLEGVELAGITYESSARCGSEDGTPGVDTVPLGRNVFRLRGEVVEVTATDHVNCGLTPSIGRWSADLLRDRVRSRAGVRVTVIHFDHLFHAGRGDAIRYFAETDERTVRARIDRFFRALTTVRRLLSLENRTFDGLSPFLPDPSGRTTTDGDRSAGTRR